MTLAAGDMLNQKYRIDRLLGEGGFGSVWLGSQLNVNRPVAIKVLRGRFDGQAERRFEIEAAALARLDDLHCVRLYDFGRTSAGESFLVMEYLEGVSLTDWASTASFEARFTVARQITAALVAAHRQNILHRDLKPDNVLVVAGASGPRAVVLDFGLAKLVGHEFPNVTVTGEVFGTPGYMSPEQLRGEKDLDVRSDVYALGAVLFQLFEGRPVFSGDSALAIAMSHLAETPPALSKPEVPPHIRHLVASMLSKNRQDRPGSMQGVLRGLTLDAPESIPVRVRTDQRWSPSPHLVLAAGALMLAVVGLIVLAASGPSDEAARPSPPPPPLVSQIQPVVTAPPNSAPDAAPALAETVDVGLPDLAGLSEGCRRPAPIEHEIELIRGDTGLFVRLPVNYRPHRPNPMLIVFHDALQNGHQALETPAIGEIADRLGLIVVAPQDVSFRAPWADRETDLERVTQQLEHVKAEFCVDDDRIAALGLGAGGRAVARLRCKDTVHAAVESGYRWFSSDRLCSRGAAPLLTLFPTLDPYAPVEGGKSCISDGGLGMFGRSAFKPLEQQIGSQREVLKCTDPKREVAVVGGTCTTYTCRTPLVSCNIQGGRVWAGQDYKLDPCVSPEDPGFPYAQVIGDFLAEHLGFP